MDERTLGLLAASTRFAEVRELAEVDSTNRYLLDQARRGAAEGMVVVADHQWAGRGRLDRSWQARPGGALLASILLRPQTDGLALAPDRRWLVTAAVALAAADACADPCSERGLARPEIKWPNDLLLEDRKLAGILAEADAGAIVVGIGINVAWAPSGAASLGPSVDRGRLLAAVLVNLEQWCDHWDGVSAAYRSRCATVGRTVRVELPGPLGGGGMGRAIVGRADGIEPDGRLRVVVDDGDDDGVHFFSAADVVHLRAG